MVSTREDDVISHTSVVSEDWSFVMDMDIQNIASSHIDTNNALGVTIFEVEDFGQSMSDNDESIGTVASKDTKENQPDQSPDMQDSTEMVVDCSTSDHIIEVAGIATEMNLRSGTYEDAKTHKAIDSPIDQSSIEIAEEDNKKIKNTAESKKVTTNFSPTTTNTTNIFQTFLGPHVTMNSKLAWRGMLSHEEIVNLISTMNMHIVLPEIKAAIDGRLGLVVNEFTPLWIVETRRQTAEDRQIEAILASRKANADKTTQNKADCFDVFQLDLVGVLDDQTAYQQWTVFRHNLALARQLETGMVRIREKFLQDFWKVHNLEKVLERLLGGVQSVEQA